MRATRRKFIKTGLLFLPSVALGQVAILKRRAFFQQAPAAGGGGGYNQPDILGWKCNEGSGTSVADSSSNGTPHACTLSASTFWGTTFTPGGSNVDLVLNGTSQFGNSASAIAYGTKIVTVEFRVFQSSYSAPSNDQYYLDSNGYNANGFAIFNRNDTGDGAFRADLIDGSGNTGTFFFARPSAGAWHHIAVVLDNSAANAPVAYVDGSAVTVTPKTDSRSNFASNYSTSTLYIGSLQGTSRWAPASMKDFRIWNGLRTAGNIASDATNYP